MNEYERLRASVPISGIDTSTPDAVVADGKCEKLHNMRYAAGTWRNVNDIPTEFKVIENNIQAIITPKVYKSWGRYVGDKFNPDGAPNDVIFEEVGFLTIDDPIESDSKLYNIADDGSVSYLGENSSFEVETQLQDIEYTLDDFADYEDKNRTLRSVTRCEVRGEFPYDKFTELFIYSTNDPYTDGKVYMEKPIETVAAGDFIWVVSQASITVDGTATRADVPFGYGQIREVVSKYDSVITLKVYTTNNQIETLTFTYDGTSTTRYHCYAYAVIGTSSTPKHILYRMNKYVEGHARPALYPLIFSLDNTYSAYGSNVVIAGYITNTEFVNAQTIRTLEYNYQDLRRYEDGDHIVMEASPDYEIIYQHPADVGHYVINSYNCIETSDGTTEKVSTISRAVFSAYGIQEQQVILQRKDDRDYNITHFGNILIITDSVERVNHYFVLSPKGYYEYNISNVKVAADIDIQKVCPNLAENVNYTAGGGSYANKGVIWDPISGQNGELQWATGDTKYNAWRGEVGLFCALRSADGEILYTTPIQIINTAEDMYGNLRLDDDQYLLSDILYSGIRIQKVDSASEDTVTILASTTNLGNGVTEDDFKDIRKCNWANPTDKYRALLDRLLPYHVMCKAKLTISIDRETPEIIDNVAVFCTRIHPHFVSESHNESVSGVRLDYQTYVSPDNLFEEPYYLIDSFSLSKFSDTEDSRRYEIVLGYSDLQRMGIVYTPTQRADSLFFKGSREYNNRLHIYDISIAPTVPDKEVFTYGVSDTDIPITECCIDYKRNNKKYKAFFKIEDINKDAQSFSLQQKICLSYPLTNVTLKLGRPSVEDEQYMLAAYEYPMDYSDILGLSYIIGDARTAEDVTDADKKNTTYQSLRKYKPLYNLMSDTQTILRDSAIPNEPNRVQVSDSNNPFSYPYNASYRVGTSENQILAINSGAIEMSDSKFGELPLYVFTKEGIYALQSGQDNVLYSAVIPINYDRIINPQTLAVNYNIVYITREGVKSLSAQTTSLLSEAINYPNNIPLLDYLQSANLYLHKPYNEIIVHNPNYDYAYIYAVNGGYWSTRDLRGVKLDSERLYIWNLIGNSASHLILNLAKHEGNEVRPISIRTRPLKFGNHEFKRLETFIARMRAVPGAAVVIRFYGSNDRVNWALMREVEFENIDIEMTLRRFPFSARYIYVEFESVGIEVAGAYFEISSMDMEYYLKFVRRLR